MILAMLLLSRCGGGSSSSSQLWTASASNPVIVMGQAMAGAQWNDPSVLKEGSTYVMYLTANSDPAPGTDVLPYRATSTDGITWSINTTALLSLGVATEFDEVGVETPSVIFFNSKYHMYYTGVPSGGLSGALAIGHATSDDGIIWTKDTGNPVLSPTGTIADWNGAQVAEPGAVVFNNNVYLFFTGVGLRSGGATPVAKQVIGLAISNDGSSFSAPAQVLEQSASYPANQDYVGYSTPSAIVYNNTIHLFHDVAQDTTGWVQAAIRHASSADGYTWVEDSNSIYTRSSFSWTAREIRSPTAINDGGMIKLWFAGDDYLDNAVWGIGYAEALDTIY